MRRCLVSEGHLLQKLDVCVMNVKGIYCYLRVVKIENNTDHLSVQRAIQTN